MLQQRISFLMVGTIEPRKGHNQILETFEILWKDGLDLRLVFVGKQGWMVDQLIKKIQTHSELNKKLYWFQEASDNLLSRMYSTCSCLIAASYAEGFGLPLVEAAQYKLPLLVRDIPVFLEIAG
jgi:glycosyltransferase involved in cell wall biosynthesis